MAQTVLITGTRAPAAIDLARSFAREGWRVHGADRLAWPIARLSSAFSAQHRLPSANADHRAFADRLIAIVERERVDLLVPTCEEAFFIARHKDRIERHCRVAVSDFDTMRRLHDKTGLPALVDGLGVEAPETHRAQSRSELEAALERLGAGVVLKPAFSRFGSRTLIRPSAAQIAAVHPTPEDPWACQRFIDGDEVCIYAVARAGTLTAFSAYRPQYRVGKGSSIMFAPATLPKLQAFARALAARNGLEGQFAFDMMLARDGRWFALECNPRATSGVHMFRPNDRLATAFSGDTMIPQTGEKSGMVGLAMLLIALPRALALGGFGGFARAARAWRLAEDVVARPGDSGPGLTQWLALGEGLALALRNRCSPLAATTSDIEWNGEPLSEQ
jgi:predicted ATP-grasp superfamily ATP-dependent carboligase